MKATIVVLPGDGIGPEVTAEAVIVLRAVARRFGHNFHFVEGLIGGAAIDATGSPLPDSTLALCRSSDAVLLGAVGGPKWERPGNPRPEQGLLRLRAELEVYANLRPVQVHDALVAGSSLREEVVRGTDLLIVRELTGGIYFGPKSRKPSPSGGEEASEICSYSTHEIERVTRRSARLARGRRGKLTSIDKANVLETSRLWRETVTRLMEAEFPDVELEHLLVDAAAMHLLKDPRRFDVVLTENLFGDILSDEAAGLPGSIGVLPSASLGDTDGPDLFEPIHGSAPELAGRRVANPYGAILSGALLLRHGLCLAAESIAVEEAVHAAWVDGWRTSDMTGSGPATTTQAVGREVVHRITKSAMTVMAT